MALGIKWSRKDRARAKQLIKAIADKAGGWQSLADKLGMEADSSRATDVGAGWGGGELRLIVP